MWPPPRQNCVPFFYTFNGRERHIRAYERTYDTKGCFYSDIYYLILLFSLFDLLIFDMNNRRYNFFWRGITFSAARFRLLFYHSSLKTKQYIVLLHSLDLHLIKCRENNYHFLRFLQWHESTGTVNRASFIVTSRSWISK